MKESEKFACTIAILAFVMAVSTTFVLSAKVHGLREDVQAYRVEHAARMAELARRLGVSDAGE